MGCTSTIYGSGIAKTGRKVDGEAANEGISSWKSVFARVNILDFGT